MNCLNILKRQFSFLHKFNHLSRMSSRKEKLEKETFGMCDDFSWLYYDSEKDVAICYICMSCNKLKKWNVFSGNMNLAFAEKGLKTEKMSRRVHEPRNIPVPLQLCQVIK